MNKDEALKLTLEALLDLQSLDSQDVWLDRWSEAIAATKEALAQPVQEPVAWMSQGGDVSRSKTYFEEMGFMNLIPLYTTAPLPVQPVQEPVAWNKQIRDCVDSLLEQAGYQPDSSASLKLTLSILPVEGVGATSFTKKPNSRRRTMDEYTVETYGTAKLKKSI